MELLIDGRKVAYQMRGKGEETVVMLQGWGTGFEMYESIASCLEKKYRMLLFDFPGFGASEEPPEPWDVEGYARFFVKLMEKLEIRDAILMGHSYGGRVILKLFGKKLLPFEVKRIVLIDAAGILPEKTVAQKRKIRRYKVLKFFANLKIVNKLCPDMIEEWKSRQGSADYRNATPIMRQCLVKAVNEDLSDLLPLVKAEALLIWGENDTATPLKDGQKMEKLMPNAGLAVIKGAGHFCFLEQPVIFQNILRSYFKIGE